MNVLLFAPDPLDIMKLVLEEEKHTIWSRKTRRRRPLFDLAILKTGELREYDKFKARCVISFIRPPIDRLPEYYFYTFDLWPTQFGIPLSEPYTIYIGTHRSIELLPETFLDTFKTGNSDIGLTTRENEYFYLLYRNPGERRVFSSRYPLPHPQPKMYLKTMKKYTRHNADPVDFEGLTFLSIQRYFDIFEIYQDDYKLSERESYNALSKSMPLPLFKTLIKGIQLHLDTQGPLTTVTNLSVSHPLYHKLCKFDKAVIDYECAYYTFTGKSVYDQKVAVALNVSIREGWTVSVSACNGTISWKI